jgi:hypothetical protein
MIGFSIGNLGGQTMARKTIAMCDRCKAEFADFSLHAREATTNLELKLTKANNEVARPGPFDLCGACLTSVIKEINKPTMVCEGSGGIAAEDRKTALSKSVDDKRAAFTKAEDKQEAEGSRA